MLKSKARKYLDKDRGLILWLFDGRCVSCGKPTTIIHEIVPISHGKASLRWKNRIPLCHSCPRGHDWAHSVGTNISIPILEKKRQDFLIKKFGLHLEQPSE